MKLNLWVKNNSIYSTVFNFILWTLTKPACIHFICLFIYLFLYATWVPFIHIPDDFFYINITRSICCQKSIRMWFLHWMVRRRRLVSMRSTRTLSRRWGTWTRALNAYGKSHTRASIVTTVLFCFSYIIALCNKPPSLSTTKEPLHWVACCLRVLTFLFAYLTLVFIFISFVFL